MLAVLPTLILLLGIPILLSIRKVNRSPGLMWLVTAFLTIAAWLFALALHWMDPLPFALGRWITPVGNGTALIYQLDAVSWPYFFALCSLSVAVVLTSAVWFQVTEEANPWAWAGILVITAAGLVAVLSGSPLALILSWTVLDVIDLVYLLQTPDRGSSSQVVLLFSSRLFGTLVACAALLVSQAAGKVMTFTELPASAGMLLLFAAGLRLGVIPLHLPYTQEEGSRRGVGTLMRLVSPAASLVVLGRLPAAVVPPNWAYLFLAFTSLAALYGAAMWATSRNELAGRPYWLICLAGMAVGCSIRGQPSSAPVWGLYHGAGGWYGVSPHAQAISLPLCWPLIYYIIRFTVHSCSRWLEWIDRLSDKHLGLCPIPIP